jgi:hypothetical protein
VFSEERTMMSHLDDDDEDERKFGWRDGVVWAVGFLIGFLVADIWTDDGDGWWPRTIIVGVVVGIVVSIDHWVQVWWGRRRTPSRG